MRRGSWKGKVAGESRSGRTWEVEGESGRGQWGEAEEKRKWKVKEESRRGKEKAIGKW
jgi:hypothetical protein